MKKSNTNMPIAFYVGLLVVFLTFFSVHMSSGLYARYTTQASGEDSARVAQFRVTDTLIVTDKNGTVLDSPLSLNASLLPGESTTYAFSVKNDSEVTVRFSVEGELVSGELPLTMTNPSVTLAPDAETTVTFVVSWPADKNDPAYGDMIALIRIYTTAEQVD
jgi:hypothetical protein